MKLDELKTEKDKHITRIFWLGLEIALIFAVPAVLGVLIGKRIDAHYGLEDKFSVAFLVFTFILSWIITVVKYKTLSKKIKKIENEITLEKANTKED